MYRFDSIPSRFTGMAIVFVLVVSVTLGVIGVKLSLNYTGERFHENFRVLSRYLAINAELGLLLKDEIMLENLAENMLTLENIFRVTVKDVTGKILVKTGRPANNRKLVSIETEVYLSKSEDNLFIGKNWQENSLGSVVVYYSLESLETFQNQMVTYFLTTTLFFVVLFSLCFFFVSRSVALSLQGILKISQDVSKGNMDVRASTRGLGAGLGEVRTLAAGFNDMLNALQQEKLNAEAANVEMNRQKTLVEVGKFSMMVAHEVKNPLTVIKGSLAILKKNNLDPATKQELINYVEDDIQRINKIVEDFLIFARPQKTDFLEMDMNLFVTGVVEKFFFVNHEIRAAVEIDTTPAMCHCDRAMMERALFNILTNAVSHASHTVRITTSVTKDMKWRILILDDGSGIKTEKVEEIFTPFFTTRSRGTGLGLAITKDITDIHRASIKAGNSESGGAWFQIEMECVLYG